MPTFYIPLGFSTLPALNPAGSTLSGTFNQSGTLIPIAVPQANAPSILQRWTLTSIYAPYAIVLLGAAAPVNYQLGVSALINETPVWAQQANGQLFGTDANTSQVLAGDLFNPLDLNAGQKLTFAWQLVLDAAVLVGAGGIWIGGSYGAGGIQPVPGVVNYDVAYHPALGRS